MGVEAREQEQLICPLVAKPKLAMALGGHQKVDFANIAALDPVRGNQVAQRSRGRICKDEGVVLHFVLERSPCATTQLY